MQKPILLDLPDQLAGKRIVLRPFRDDDLDALHTAIEESRQHLRPWMPWWNQPREDTLAFIRRMQSQRALREGFGHGIFDRETGRFLGGAGVHVHSWDVPSFEIGYWIRQSEEGKGYVTEAAKLLTRFAFEELGANRVLIRVESRNVRSKAVPERLGYALEGTHRNVDRDPVGELCDMMMYAMIPEEYERASKSW